MQASATNAFSTVLSLAVCAAMLLGCWHVYVNMH